METSTYDPCLLITTEGPFATIGMQTDDTLMLVTPEFSAKEDNKLKRAEFRAKDKTKLTPRTPLDFNGAKLSMMDDGVILMLQKGQGSKLEPINKLAPDRSQRYLEQRARGAYIASICQPEASFDLSTAAQIQKPEPADYEKLNKRIRW
ncbi:hypothetical protein K3495_g17185, partial [Podosphaera aphanis]